MPDCVQNCPIAARVGNLEGQIEEFQAQNSSSHKEIFARLNTLEKSEAVQEVHYNAIIAKLDNLTHKVERLDNLTKKVENLDNLTKKVEKLEQKPAKRWEALVGDVVKLVVAAVVGFFLARAGLG